MGVGSFMSKKDLESLIDEALGNIRDDRKVAREFLNEVANQIARDAEQNKYLSPVAAKHIETLQRSNEQLVKIISLRQKDQSHTLELSDKDKEELFDLIQKEPS
tara:strand:- start:93 stop:404 length:312 start_codon:yes stop_codon:yes gene_type:complete